MRISDWSSDVCSSDLSIISFTGKDLLRHGPGLQCVTFLAQLGARLLQQVGQLDGVGIGAAWNLSARSEEHTSELQSLMRISYAVFCLKKKNQHRSPTKTERCSLHRQVERQSRK